MNASLADSWNRYALLVHLSVRLKEKGTLGKKALQKLIYLLQELEKVPLGYRFRFFTYGPFSDDLAYTLDVVENIKGVKIAYDVNSSAHKISPGDGASNVIQKGKDFIAIYNSKVERLVKNFGNLTAKELELLATIVYLLDERGELDDASLIDAVVRLKPKYERARIKRAITELTKFGYIM
jgi:uncharacterized protein